MPLGTLLAVNMFRPVAVGLLVAALVGGCAGRPDVRVEHRPIQAAPAPLSDAGPPLGTYRPDWRTTISYRTGPPTVHLVGGQLVVVSQAAIDAYDARTGKPSWHFREPGRRIAGFAITDGVVVAKFRSNTSNDEEQHLLGLDAGSGELLWENTEDWDLTYDGDGGSSQPLEPADAVDGIVPISVEYDDERLGVEARTGDTVWKLTDSEVAAGECEPAKGEPGGDPKASVLPVHFHCEAQDLASGGLRELLLLVDPESGEPRWSRRVDSAIDVGSADVEVRGGVTMVEPAGERAAPELIGPDGRTLFAPEAGRCSVSCELHVSGGRVLFQYVDVVGQTDRGSEETEDRLAAVDPKTGRTVRMRDPGENVAPYVAAGGKLYGLVMAHGDSEGGLITDRLLPAGLAVLDVAGQRRHRVPMPYPSHLVFPPAKGVVAQPVAVGGGRVFTVRQVSDAGRLDGPYRAQLVAYTSSGTAEPVELGGVSPDDWPDPCTLFGKVPPGDREPESPMPGPEVRLGSVTLERTVCTRYGTSVRISWVAATEREAKSLFPGGEPSSVGADEQRALSNIGMAYRVGRTILSVESYDDDIEAVTRQVIRNLRTP